MDRRRILIIVAIVILAIAIVMLLWWWFSRDAILTPAPSGQANQASQEEQLPTASAGLPTDTPEPEEAKLEATLTAIAMTFAERFGSFSNQGGYTNLDDLKSLMTIRMIGWTENYKSEHPIDSNAVYAGVNTKALSAIIISLDETIGRAEIRVSTQREDAQGSTVNPRIYYQQLLLLMAQDGGQWKIDSAEWQ